MSEAVIDCIFEANISMFFISVDTHVYTGNKAGKS
jgi:hypothetical protein